MRPTAGQVRRTLRELGSLRREHLVIEVRDGDLMPFQDLNCPATREPPGHCRCGADRVNTTVEDALGVLEAFLEEMIAQDKPSTGAGRDRTTMRAAGRSRPKL